jgi:hypothetical protein
MYLLKNKIYAFENFKAFRALPEKHRDRPMKILRSNNRGEYLGKDFEMYLL